MLSPTPLTTTPEEADYMSRTKEWPGGLLATLQNPLNAEHPGQGLHREKARFAAHLKQIWLEPDKKSAKRAAAALSDDFEKRFPEAVRCLEEGLETRSRSLTSRRSTRRGSPRPMAGVAEHGDPPERSRVVGVFPSVDCYRPTDDLLSYRKLGGLGE